MTAHACELPGCGVWRAVCGRAYPWRNEAPDLATQLRTRCVCGHFYQCHRQPPPTHHRGDWDE